MTEVEWLACDDPNAMMTFLSSLGISIPKHRFLFFWCGFFRLRKHLDSSVRHLLELTEAHASNVIDEGEFNQRINEFLRDGNDAELSHDVWGFVTFVTRFSQLPDFTPHQDTLNGNIVRCLCSNPFHPITLSPSWLTSTVLALAQGIYSDRAFERMPILADALQDAGCDYEDILNHCRQPGEHCRGCWVVDLILDKK